MIELKTEEQFALMREAGLIVRGALEMLRGEVKDGVTTGRLDAIAEEYIRSHDATPSFKGYGDPPFPAVICASINHEVVHGIPGEAVVRDGDILSIDCGAIYQGWHGDAAITVGCGEITPELTELLRVTEQAMWHGIAAIADGKTGRLFPAGDMDAMREATAGLLADPEGARALGARAREHVFAELTWDHHALKVLELLGLQGRP